MNHERVTALLSSLTDDWKRGISICLLVAIAAIPMVLIAGGLTLAVFGPLEWFLTRAEFDALYRVYYRPWMIAIVILVFPILLSRGISDVAVSEFRLSVFKPSLKPRGQPKQEQPPSDEE